MTEHYKNHWGHGQYRCAKCGHTLFASDTKFNSGTSWPSFRSALPEAVATQPDNSFGMERVELLCANCGEHLGHVFEDGRYCGDTHPEAGQRYCILSSALDFTDLTP